jgi:GntR family transcriptional regulator, rspAB operon transcriptional repressor
VNRTSFLAAYKVAPLAIQRIHYGIMSLDHSPVTLATLDRVKPLREQVYQVIRRAIVTGQLKPGDAVDEVDIAHRLGISRTPVREAVKKIFDEGLIEVKAQSGTYVAGIRRPQVEEAYLIRSALELESVARAAPAITPRHVHDLEDIVAAHAKAFSRKQFSEALARDDDFHRYIAEINGLSMLWRAVDISKAQMDRCRHLVASSAPVYGNRTIAEHKTIIRALKSGDRKTATAAMRAHLDTSLKNALKLLDAASNPITISRLHQIERDRVS